MQKNIIVRDKVIAITSVSFSKNSYLRERLLRHFPLSVFNQEKKLSREELKSFIKDADGVIASLEVLDEDVLRSCPRLKVIAKYGVGLDNIDQDACKKYRMDWRGQQTFGRGADAWMYAGFVPESLSLFRAV